jgi:hypothetical protein
LAIDLGATLVLPLASRYAFPDDGRATLPTSYGDFFAPEVIPADSDDGGFLPAVMIDRLSWIFCLNSRPIPNAPAPLIYAGDQLQDTAVYTWSPSVDIEGIGQPIAAVQFNTNPGTRAISWRGHGTASAGFLIQNPLYALFDILSAYAGWTLDDFDLNSCFNTFRTLAELEAGLNWCFWQQERTIKDWLQEMLRCYHTDHFETADGKLAMVLDRGILGLSVSVLATINAQTDMEGTEDDVEFISDEANYTNELTVKRRMRWTDNTYTDEPTVDFRPSVGLYGPLRGEVELPAVYTDAHGLVWVRAFFARYGFLPGIVRFTVRGLGYATALPGTYLGLTVPWYGWTKARLLKVLNQEPDPFGARVSFECFDCQRFVDDTLVLPMVPVESVRRRIRVPDQSVDITPPGPASGLTATGSYRQVVLRWTAPGDLDYSYTEIWASTLNDRSTATHVRNSSRGAPGQNHEELFVVGDETFYWVWLMTVDNSANGRNGGSGSTGGNWFPANPTGGIAAAPVLVDTPGIATEGVTFTHTTGARIPAGTYTGEWIVADSFLGGLFQQGDVIAFGFARISLSPFCTAFLQIKEGGLNGFIVGVTPPIFNSLSAITANVRIDCWGLDFGPSWNGAYVLTAQVINQAGANVPWTIGTNGADLFLRHTKR